MPSLARPKTARGAALQALLDIDERGAYASVARDRALERAGLSERDRALATELIYGATRHRKTIDHAIDSLSSRRVARMDPVARNALRLGAYQVLFLEDLPPEVAVNETVAATKAVAHRGIASFVNAVLRALAARRWDVPFPDPARNPVAYAAARHSHPEWLVARWMGRFGLEGTLKLCEANNERPRLTLRANALRTSPDRLLESLVSAGVAARRSEWLPEALEVLDRAELFSQPLYAEGAFFVQDASSMLVAHVLDPHPGESILDIAAAPGGKATHIAERMADVGLVVAVDVRPARARLIEENAARLGLRSIRVVPADGTRLPPDVSSIPFDRVLVDPPCTGTGVLRRRPDLRWRRKPEDLEDLVALQAALLESAAERVGPGGVLVYSTCSIEPEENSWQISAFLLAHPDFSLEPARPYLPVQFSRAFPDAGNPFVETFPHVHGMDGFFIARLVRAAR